MASTVQTAAAQSQQQPSASNETPLSWEGDKMFNIYIYDYCHKRGFKKTAHELLQEANISPDSKPPINARQGLLFEWWSVFWVLFSAKANGNGSDDAMVYTQHQANSQAMQRQLHQQRMQPPSQAPMPGGPLGQPGGPQQPPGQRIMNGPMGQRLGPPFSMNGPLPNGVTSGQLPPGQIPPGPGPFPNMGGPGPQPNGIPGSGPPQSLGASPAQSQNFQPLFPNQRPLGAPGGPQQSPQPPPQLQQQQRQNGGPFQPSPTMAHSPGQGQQQPTPQQQLQPSHPHGQPPMGQLGLGPSPHMQPLHRAMPPPQGLNSLNSGVQPGNTPNPAFAQLAGRPPSRATTPGGQSMMQSSPSLSARQPPGGGMIQPNSDFELQQIHPPVLAMVRQELGFGDRDINQLTPQERGRLMQAARARLAPKPEGPGPAGGLQPANAHLRGMPSQLQQLQPRLKRSSTTPEEQPRNDSSPPQKRPRPSPEQHPVQGILPQQPQQVPLGNGPQHGMPGMPMPGQNQMMMMRGPTQMSIAGGVPQLGQPPRANPMNMNLSQPLGGPQLGGVAMNPQHPVGHPGHPGQPGMMHPQMQYRLQNMQALKGPVPPQVMNPTIQGSGNNTAPTQADPLHPGGPGGGGPQFNRLPPQTKPVGMMLPPSSANKDQGKDGKPDDATRNAPGNAGQTPNAGGTAPSTPAPGVPGSNAPGPQGPPPATNGAPNANMAPSPSSSMGAPLNPGPMVNQQQALSDPLFPTDFMQHLSNSLDDFDSNIFRNDGDINFERDFGQWFNGDDVPLDLK